jgi:AAA+ superfamily predicted ATPase
LYNQSVLFNEKENGAAFVKTAQLLFNPQTLKDAADKTDGLSHAEIKDMIVAIRKKAFGSQDGMITRKHITDAVYQAIEKHQAFDADREQQKERLMQKHE